MITNLVNSYYAAFGHEVLKEIQTQVYFGGLKAQLLRNKTKRYKLAARDVLVTCRIVETSVSLCQPLHCAGNSVAAESAFNLESSSARAQKAPPSPEYEKLCLFLLQLECKENTGQVH